MLFLFLFSCKQTKVIFPVRVIVRTKKYTGIPKVKVYLDGQYYGKTDEYGTFLTFLKKSIGETIQVRVVDTKGKAYHWKPKQVVTPIPGKARNGKRYGLAFYINLFINGDDISWGFDKRMLLKYKRFKR